MLDLAACAGISLGAPLVTLAALAELDQRTQLTAVISGHK
jgi:hypothetical protein